MATLALRPDVEVVPAEAEDGRPALLLHDPVTGGYDRVEWPETDIIELLREGTTFPALLQAVRTHTTLKPAADDLRPYLTELGANGWLRGAAFYSKAYREPRRQGLAGLFSRLLFVRLPLLRPDGFLRRTAGAVRLLLNPLVRYVLALCGLAGLYLALPRWEEYWRDGLSGATAGQIPSLFLSLIAVKAVHEFAHAYAATLAGARVREMGLALMFLLPLPYTDVTDAWRLPWSQRLRVAAAGLLAEAAVAGVALFLWALSPPGDAAAALARLSSVAVASTLVTNLNPGPRFDGYYILCCLFRMENLRARSVAMFRSWLWRRVVGIAGAGGEEMRLAPGRRLGMALLACYTVLYRILLGLGLAAGAYYVLPKAAALPVTALLAWLFLLLPVAREGVLLAGRWRQMRPTLWMLAVVLALAAAGVWFFGAWPRRLAFPAVAKAGVVEAVRTERGGTVAEVMAERGGRVAAGDVLTRITSPADAPALRQAEWALREAELSRGQAWTSATARLEAPARDAGVRRRRVERDAALLRGTLLDVRAEVSGTLADWNTFLVPGVPVAAGEAVGWIVDGPVAQVSCYPDMATGVRLARDDMVWFYPDSGEEPIAGRVARVDTSRPEALEDGELAAVLGAVPRDGTLLLPAPYAKVTVVLDTPAGRHGQTGRVWAWTRPESLADRAGRWLSALAARESAF